MVCEVPVQLCPPGQVSEVFVFVCVCVRQRQNDHLAMSSSVLECSQRAVASCSLCLAPPTELLSSSSVKDQEQKQEPSWTTSC